MSEEQARERISYLSERINYHRKKYYLEDSPEISDYDFDMLLDQVRIQEV